MSAPQLTVGRSRRGRLPRRPLIVAAVLVVVLAALCATLGRTLAPYDPAAQDLLTGLQLPSLQHPLGTDNAGRDILSRVIVGTGRTMLGPLIIAASSALIASVLGLLAGYRGGWVDSAIMRGADLLYAFPALLAAIVLIGVIGGGYLSAVFVMVLLTWPSDVRIVRGATLDQRNLPYVDAARTLGLRQARIIGVHVWPNVLPLIVTNAFLNFAYGLVALSSLSFLGLGVEPGAADWGLMISENLALLQANPTAVLAPGVALVLVAVSMNLLGDAVYEALQDRGRAR
jgi:peptide/nickel transport system permease protein